MHMSFTSQQCPLHEWSTVVGQDFSSAGLQAASLVMTIYDQVVRIGQSFMLLQQCRKAHQDYKRILIDHVIVAGVRKLGSSKNSQVELFNLLDAEIHVPSGNNTKVASVPIDETCHERAVIGPRSQSQHDPHPRDRMSYRHFVRCGRKCTDRAGRQDIPCQ